MEIKDELAALRAIRENTHDEERKQMIIMLKRMPLEKRQDLWHGLTPEDLVDVLRSLLESGGSGHVFECAEEPLCHPYILPGRKFSGQDKSFFNPSIVHA